MFISFAQSPTVGTSIYLNGRQLTYNIISLKFIIGGQYGI
jgi:hypothetical protein